jgi:hypothetical protein
LPQQDFETLPYHPPLLLLSHCLSFLLFQPSLLPPFDHPYLNLSLLLSLLQGGFLLLLVQLLEEKDFDVFLMGVLFNSIKKS